MLKLGIHTDFNNKQSSKEMWKTLRSIGVGKTVDTRTISIPANDLNNHYAAVSSVAYPDRIQKCISEYESRNVLNRDLFNFTYVLPEDVASAVLSIRSTAQGVDGISIHTLPAKISGTLFQDAITFFVVTRNF